PLAMPLRSVPVWQKGTPQSMQRAAWVWSFFSSKCSWNSCQSLMRSLALRSAGSSRRYSMNPVGLPMSGVEYQIGMKKSVKGRRLKELRNGVAKARQQRVAGKKTAGPEQFELVRVAINPDGTMPQIHHPGELAAVRARSSSSVQSFSVAA